MSKSVPAYLTLDVKCRFIFFNFLLHWLDLKTWRLSIRSRGAATEAAWVAAARARSMATTFILRLDPPKLAKWSLGRRRGFYTQTQVNVPWEQPLLSDSHSTPSTTQQLYSTHPLLHIWFVQHLNLHHIWDMYCLALGQRNEFNGWAGKQPKSY